MLLCSRYLRRNGFLVVEWAVLAQMKKRKKKTVLCLRQKWPFHRNNCEDFRYMSFLDCQLYIRKDLMYFLSGASQSSCFMSPLGEIYPSAKVQSKIFRTGVNVAHWHQQELSMAPNRIGSGPENWLSRKKRK